MTKFKLGIW